ncbi:MAG: cytochrome c3 family protein [Terriglobia bacterium]|nr:cytochrome c3 family protein [Terriglobia bacterium]
MKLRASFFCAMLLLFVGVLSAQITTDVLGDHNLGPGSKAQGPLALGCVYCHAPHSGVGGATPLWNQTLSKQTYSTYTSSTAANTTTQPVLQGSSSLCLSCHDGTVALGTTAAYGKIAMNPIAGTDSFGANLQQSHPISLNLPIKDSVDLAASLVASHKTADPTGKVQLINGNVECNSCHNPHVQSIDQTEQNFLAIPDSNSQLCFACHDPARTMTGQVNPLLNWSTGIHATATNQVSANSGLGSYPTVAQNGCTSCHQNHNAPGSARLLNAPATPFPNADASAQPCAQCHNGGSALSPGVPNIFDEYLKQGKGAGQSFYGTAHPWPAGINTHDADEATLLNNNRHATCADCHNSHAAQQVQVFNDAPGTRVSEANTAGISETDGTSVLNPAPNQYQICLRCHGNSSGTPLTGFGYEPLRASTASTATNVIPQFNSSALSKHPVMTKALLQNQPSLLPAMLNENGATTPATRSMGSQIFCTDCHNSDDNREFGGTGPTGPHGSQFWHLLERRYEMSQAPSPGAPITNTYPSPSLDASSGVNGGPYALCAKCHDLSTNPGGVLSDASFKPSAVTNKGGHYTHVWGQGLSCSTCHTAHGTSAGPRLVDFDLNVVAQNNGAAIKYDPTSNTCTLTCHGWDHNSTGTVTQHTTTTTGALKLGSAR